MSNSPAEEEILQLRQRVAAAEAAIAMFMTAKPRIDPRKMALAYCVTYSTPIIGVGGIEACITASERGLANAARKRLGR
jgi:hypothetical protein